MGMPLDEYSVSSCGSCMTMVVRDAGGKVCEIVGILPLRKIRDQGSSVSAFERGYGILGYPRVFSEWMMAAKIARYWSRD
uniref:Uncharacterized protein n=1 Tax=Leersia perrieri TaxID=77586 RepID=A0A0D9XHA4_9ORYZ